MATLNELFSSLKARRRYEVWFLRVGLTDGAGAWWFRYLLLNPGRNQRDSGHQIMPVQVWATWFPAGAKPQTFIQGFSLDSLEISRRGQAPFHLRVGDNQIDEESCRGALHVDGHAITWSLRYQSTFRATLSNKGWIGFSRTPHSDAVFSGEIALDGRTFVGDVLGFGVQGHNCGYRHRKFWTWTHAYFPRAASPPTTLEALTYEMPFGLVFRKAVLWHDGQAHVFRDLRETENIRENMEWKFCCTAHDGLRIEAVIKGSGPSRHCLSYTKTDGKGCFDVINNSLASASVLIERPGDKTETLESATGAVLETVG